jgi:hypothetical protein
MARLKILAGSPYQIVPAIARERETTANRKRKIAAIKLTVPDLLQAPNVIGDSRQPVMQISSSSWTYKSYDEGPLMPKARYRFFSTSGRNQVRMPNSGRNEQIWKTK